MGKGEAKILLVDDEKSFCRPMEIWLKSLHYQVATAENGEDALALIEKDRPTIVFLDIVMPGLGGIETLRRIRKTDQDLPVIMFTAHPRDENITEAIKLGIDGFFPKGENFNRLLILINTVLNRLERK